jgi:hypothetical protein
MTVPATVIIAKLKIVSATNEWCFKGFLAQKLVLVFGNKSFHLFLAAQSKGRQ